MSEVDGCSISSLDFLEVKVRHSLTCSRMERWSSMFEHQVNFNEATLKEAETFLFNRFLPSSLP